jgi:S-adenosyl methyltransferase
LDEWVLEGFRERRWRCDPVHQDPNLRQDLAACRGAADLGAADLGADLVLFPDEDDPHAIVTRLMEAVPSGSWLALSHPARDVHTQQVTEAASRFNQLAPAKATLRPRAEILRFFDGLELLEPGLVQVHQWRPGVAAPGHNRAAAGYCGLARKA